MDGQHALVVARSSFGSEDKIGTATMKGIGIVEGQRQWTPADRSAALVNGNNSGGPRYRAVVGGPAFSNVKTSAQ